jgi:predicted ATPase/class 3 adenylate cyclase
MSDYRALLLTDVVDSTKLSEQLGNEAMAQVWAAHDRVARDLLRERGGREIDKTDGMLLMFEYAADAVDYALAYHRALAALPVPLKARAGLHVGPVILRENSADDVARGAKPLEVEGLAKPTAARVMAVARGGQLLLTDAAREALGKTRLRVVSHGHWLLKGLGEPVELVEAGEYESSFVPPVDGDKAQRVVRSGERWLPVDELPNNLPQQATTFIGRERELREVKDLLERTRLLTLLGMGGLGKTRLSLQVAAELRHKFPDGTWFVDLAPLRDASLVVSEVAQVLGVREEPGRPLLETLCAFLKSRQLMLVLDNCEHVTEVVGRLTAAVLRVAPQVQILASSREALHVPGEQVYPVLPLPQPAPGDDLTRLRESTAVRLFVDRVRLQRPGFQLTENDAPTVAELVRRLEGIPLAIELAAARTRMMSLADINSRLKDRYKLLTGGGKVLLERQQTLRALVDWSYDLLHDHERLLLARLSVFAGGFDLAAAEQVCGTEPMAPEDVLDLLGALADKSLLMLDEQDFVTRYRMLETIRDYAREKLEQFGEGGVVRARHCGYFFGVAKAVRDGLNGPEQVESIRRGEADLDNLRAAIALALQGGADSFLAVKFAVALQGFWTLRGYVSEGRQVVRAALALDTVAASELAQAHALYVGAALAYCQSDHVEARRMLERCLELRRALGDDLSVAGTLSTLSMARLLAGDVAGAAATEREGLEIFRRLGERRGQALGLLHLAQVAVFRGDDEDARGLLAECLELARVIENREIEGECELVLGEIAYEAGDPVAAGNHLKRSLVVCADAGDKRGEANATWWLGKISLASGDVATARQRLETARRAFEAFEMREALLDCLEDLAAVELAEGHAERAARIAGSCARSRERLQIARSERRQQRWTAKEQEIRAASGPDVFGAAWDEGQANGLAGTYREEAKLALA